MSDANGYGSSLAREAAPPRLRDALYKARIEAADRSAVIVELRDAEVARLEILNEALDPVFAQVPDSIDMFDRGISRGETPRLWVDMVAHVVMGRDKRMYRFVQDTRNGRITLAEAHDAAGIVTAVTNYIARRMIEREQALVSVPVAVPAPVARQPQPVPVRKPRSRIWVFLAGMIVGAAALFGLALLVSMQKF